MRFVTLQIIFLALLGISKPALSIAEEQSVTVILSTSLGDIELMVYPQKAPLSAGDFLNYVDRGLYQGAAFYRVVRPDNDNGLPVIEVIQGGLLTETPPTEPVTHESTQQTGIKHLDGTISLARRDVGTATAAAFFITIGDQPSMDFGGSRNADKQGFAAFGRVVKGMEVVRAIQKIRDTLSYEDSYMKGQMLSNPIMIESVQRKN
ncbi:peptidylprolyl isomerase [Aequoribacter fuscus]|nr:peptidylprolyl isomerase [Aequoribacter fuscus]QHJ87745.1 peptidylprolyl isomerase [Aequoribacter fuscus]